MTDYADYDLTVADLTDEHVGWEIQVADANPVVHHRAFVLGGIRRWEYPAGHGHVGLVDTWTSPVATERHYSPDTPCRAVRQARRPRRRRR